MTKKYIIPLEQIQYLVDCHWKEPEVAEFFGCSVGYIKRMYPGVLKRGRPLKIPKEEYFRQVQAMATYGCTEEEMRDGLDIGLGLFIKWKKLPEFSKALKKGRAIFKRSIRQGQVKSALGGNPTSLIWLAKQFLGQTDSGLLNDDTGKSSKFDAEKILGTCGEE